MNPNASPAPNDPRVADVSAPVIGEDVQAEYVTPVYDDWLAEAARRGDIDPQITPSGLAELL